MQPAVFEVFARSCSLCGGAFMDRMKAVQGFGFSPDKFSERRGAVLRQWKKKRDGGGPDMEGERW